MDDQYSTCARAVASMAPRPPSGRHPSLDRRVQQHPHPDIPKILAVLDRILVADAANFVGLACHCHTGGDPSAVQVLEEYADACGYCCVGLFEHAIVSGVDVHLQRGRNEPSIGTRYIDLVLERCPYARLETHLELHPRSFGPYVYRSRRNIDNCRGNRGANAD